MEENRSVTAYLGLGANLGDRKDHLRRALELLEESGAARVIAVSSLYESEPIGWDGGPWYLNAVARIRTSLSPQRLLRATIEAERRLGRVRTVPNAPRPIDLDILLYGNQSLHEPGLTVPHPRMLDRAFVLWPLAEIDPDVEVAPGLTARNAKDRLESRGQIRLLEGCDAVL